MDDLVADYKAHNVHNRTPARLVLTHFKTVKAKLGIREHLTLDDFVDRFAKPQVYRTKTDCPLISLATFKADRRSDSDVEEVFGLAGDYDAGLVSPEEACRRLARLSQLGG